MSFLLPLNYGYASASPSERPGSNIGELVRVTELLHGSSMQTPPRRSSMHLTSSNDASPQYAVLQQFSPFTNPSEGRSRASSDLSNSSRNRYSPQNFAQRRVTADFSEGSPLAKRAESMSDQKNVLNLLCETIIKNDGYVEKFTAEAFNAFLPYKSRLDSIKISALKALLSNKYIDEGIKHQYAMWLSDEIYNINAELIVTASAVIAALPFAPEDRMGNMLTFLKSFIGRPVNHNAFTRAELLSSITSNLSHIAGDKFSYEPIVDLLLKEIGAVSESELFLHAMSLAESKNAEFAKNALSFLESSLYNVESLQKLGALQVLIKAHKNESENSDELTESERLIISQKNNEFAQIFYDTLINVHAPFNFDERAVIEFIYDIWEKNLITDESMKDNLLNWAYDFTNQYIDYDIFFYCIVAKLLENSKRAVNDNYLNYLYAYRKNYHEDQPDHTKKAIIARTLFNKVTERDQKIREAHYLCNFFLPRSRDARNIDGLYHLDNEILFPLGIEIISKLLPDENDSEAKVAKVQNIRQVVEQYLGRIRTNENRRAPSAEIIDLLLVGVDVEENIEKDKKHFDGIRQEIEKINEVIGEFGFSDIISFLKRPGVVYTKLEHSLATLISKGFGGFGVESFLDALQHAYTEEKAKILFDAIYMAEDNSLTEEEYKKALEVAERYSAALNDGEVYSYKELLRSFGKYIISDQTGELEADEKEKYSSIFDALTSQYYVLSKKEDALAGKIAYENENSNFTSLHNAFKEVFDQENYGSLAEYLAKKWFVEIPQEEGEHGSESEAQSSDSGAESGRLSF